MAINKEFLKRTLSVNIEDGVTAEGGIKTKARTFSGIRESATAEALHSAGMALGSLMTTNIDSIVITDKNELVEA